MEVPLLDVADKTPARHLFGLRDLSGHELDIITILGGVNSVLDHYIAANDLSDESSCSSSIVSGIEP